MKQKKILYIFMAVIITGFYSCKKDALNIQPPNLITQSAIFSSSASVDAYFASLYSDLPMEDYSFCNWQFGNFPGNGNQYTANWTDEAFDSHNSEGQLSDVFAQIYQAIRNVNNLIALLPAQSQFTSQQLNTWLGEAMFIRGYDYFGLVKYYGGVPIILTVQPTPEPVARNKEVEVWNQIKSDLDSAALLIPGSYNVYGRATKWAAYALEARAMLHAATIGKYDNTGNLSQTGGINGVDAASAGKYMQAAFDAANKVINSGQFSLYMKYPNDLVKNFEYLFYDCKQGDANTEEIFSRGYDYATTNRTHSQDLMALPHAIESSTGYANRLMPSMDMAEKFQNTDGTSGALGSDKGYTTANNVNVMLHYQNLTDPFAKKDPRFAATIIAPGTAFRNSSNPVLGLQGGWITSQRGVIYNGTIYNGSNYNQYFDISTKSFTSSPANPLIYGTGNSGGSPNDLGTDDAFWLKKWTDPASDISLIHDYSSRTSWLDLRYGEVLMDFAEASFELGHPTSEALDAVNQIRARAGMPPYITITPNEIRNERMVEFAFENKNYWDFVRWRTLTTYFNNRQEYGVRIYYDIDTKDYVFIKVPGATKTYVDRDYYFDIPGNDINSNSAISSQINGGHNPGY
jgi:hypothetical protein